MIVAVLQQRARVRLHSHDVFVSTVGGARITEPAGDLAIGARDRLGLEGSARSRPTWSRSARSAWPASCAGSRDIPHRLAEAGFLQPVTVGYSAAMCQPWRCANSRQTRNWSAIDASRWFSDEYRA